MNYFYAQNGQQMGPVPEEQLAAMAAQGAIQPDTLVWREGMAEWAPYSSIATAPTTPGAAVECTVCHQTFPGDQTIKYGTVHVCAGCKPKFMQGLREGASVTGALEYAGIGARLGADILDGILLWVVNMALTFGVTAINQDMAPVASILGLVVGFGYQMYFIGSSGQTPGKKAVGVKVVKPDGGSVSYGNALGRAAAEMLSGCILGIGYLMAFWDPEKRTLHDRLAGTRVIKVRK
jgi:uncharacterized RDD family membrane protein YckC